MQAVLQWYFQLVINKASFAHEGSKIASARKNQERMNRNSCHFGWVCTKKASFMNFEQFSKENKLLVEHKQYHQDHF